MKTTQKILLRENVSLIIFDMDGVIADTAEAHKLAWREYLSRFNKPFTDDQFKMIFGTGNSELCQILFPDRDLSDEDIERIENEKEALFRKNSTGLLVTYAGFFEFLDLCDKYDVRMAVGSSACRANVDFVLQELGISNRFVSVVSADDVEKAKPAPDIFLKAAEIAGVSPIASLVIEDSTMGIEAAGTAGMRVVGLTTTHQAHELDNTDLLSKDFKELRKLIVPLSVGAA